MRLARQGGDHQRRGVRHGCGDGAALRQGGRQGRGRRHAGRRGRKRRRRHRTANGAAVFMPLDVTDEAGWQQRGRRHGGAVRPAGHPGEQRRHQRQRGDRPAGHRRVGPADGGERARRLPRHRSTPCWQMQKTGGGSIVNLSSISGVHRPDDDSYGLQRVQGRGAHADQIDRRAVRPGRHPLPTRCIPG